MPLCFCFQLRRPCSELVNFIADEKSYGIARKPVKPTLYSNTNSCSDSKSTHNNESHWISDDSEEAKDLIDQYLENGRKEKTRRVKLRPRTRPNFVEEDDDDVDENNRRCYVCSQTIHVKSEKEYEAHVERCITKQEARAKGIGNEDTFGKLWLYLECTVRHAFGPLLVYHLN